MRFVLPIFRDAQLRIQAPLGHVFRFRAGGRDLQHQIRRLAHFPQAIGREGRQRGTQGQHDVGRDVRGPPSQGGINGFVIQAEIGFQNVGCAPGLHQRTQGGVAVRHGVVLFLRTRHGGSVVDRIGIESGSRRVRRAQPASFPYAHGRHGQVHTPYLPPVIQGSKPPRRRRYCTTEAG